MKKIILLFAAILLFVQMGCTDKTIEPKPKIFGMMEIFTWVDKSVLPSDHWVNSNHRIYDVAKKYGDNGIKVFLTEFGWPDSGDEQRDRNYAEWYHLAYNYVVTQMPYVEAMHVYCLLNYTDYLGIDISWGIFKMQSGKYIPKQRVHAILEIFGGTGDIEPR